MASERRSGATAARAHAESKDMDETAKDDLQRRLDETRESISQTVTDIKDTVVEEYQSVKESVSNTLDWREQFRSHPIAWCIGALSVGYVVGNSVAAAFKETKGDDQLLAHLAALGERFSEELTKKGMSILTPALTGTILVPMLTSKINELTGIDISDWPDQILGQAVKAPKSKAGSKSKKRNGKAKKGKKKNKKAQAGGS